MAQAREVRAVLAPEQHVEVREVVDVPLVCLEEVRATSDDLPGRDRSEVLLPFADDGAFPGREGPTIGGSFTITGRTILEGRIPDRIDGTLSSTSWGTHDVSLTRSGAAGCAPRDA